MIVSVFPTSYTLESDDRASEILNKIESKADSATQAAQSAQAAADAAKQSADSANEKLTWTYFN